MFLVHPGYGFGSGRSTKGDAGEGQYLPALISESKIHIQGECYKSQDSDYFWEKEEVLRTRHIQEGHPKKF